MPFAELFFRLAVYDHDRPGFVGQITSNSFMKREFGKKLIEDFFPTVDLTRVIGTSGAYIPGHGTPTVILIANRRMPRTQFLRAVLGIRGEPSAPSEPAKGLVWTSIVENIDSPGTDTAYVSILDLSRERLSAHPVHTPGHSQVAARSSSRSLSMTITLPWTPSAMRLVAPRLLGKMTLGSTGPSEPLNADKQIAQVMPFVVGEVVRDYVIGQPPVVLWPYTDPLQPSWIS